MDMVSGRAWCSRFWGRSPDGGRSASERGRHHGSVVGAERAEALERGRRAGGAEQRRHARLPRGGHDALCTLAADNTLCTLDPYRWRQHIVYTGCQLIVV